jgi:hypothetical protein
MAGQRARAAFRSLKIEYIQKGMLNSRRFVAPDRLSPHLGSFAARPPGLRKKSPGRTARRGRNPACPSYFANLANETSTMSLRIRPADDFVIPSLETEKTCAAVECCETRAKNVGAFHSLCKISHGRRAIAQFSSPH